MSTSADKLVEDYLDRLERELADFPSARRRELVQEISEHIAEARAGLESENEAEIRNLLDRMGDPADIAAEARGQARETAPAAAPVERRSGALDVAALILLLIGGARHPRDRLARGRRPALDLVSVDGSAEAARHTGGARGPGASRGSPPRRRVGVVVLSVSRFQERETT